MSKTSVVSRDHLIFDCAASISVSPMKVVNLSWLFAGEVTGVCYGDELRSATLLGDVCGDSFGDFFGAPI